MELGVLAILITGLLAGGVIGFLLAKFIKPKLEDEAPQLKVDLRLEQERNDQLAKDLGQLNEELRDERQKAIQLHGENSKLLANYTNLEEKLGSQKEEMELLQSRFAAEFKNLANDIFEEKSKKFTDQNKLNLDALLKPLGDKIHTFEKRVEENSKEAIRWNSSLRTELEHLKQLNQKITQEAENLTKALKGDTKVQGNWGEVVLERILEKSGLVKDREYFTQESITSEAGRRLRPDVIIRLPDEKNLIIDAKASLIAYERYTTADDESERAQYLKDHLNSIKAHVKGLSEKNYHTLFEKGSLDYVLMFVPIESAFALLVQHGGELYNEAHAKNIIIVSPATLIATLRTVSSIWKHEYQNRNALEIARQGGALYDKFVAFVADLMEVGKSLDRSKQQYTEAMKKLVEGKDNLVRKTERLKELDAKTSKSLPDNLLDRANVPDRAGAMTQGDAGGRLFN